MDKQLLDKVIQRKKKTLKVFTLEQMGLAGFIGGFVGLVLGEFYSTVFNSLFFHIANVFVYAAIGAMIGYITSKRKKEDLVVELMVLENLNNLQND